MWKWKKPAPPPRPQTPEERAQAIAASTALWKRVEEQDRCRSGIEKCSDCVVRDEERRKEARREVDRIANAQQAIAALHLTAHRVLDQTWRHMNTAVERAQDEDHAQVLAKLRDVQFEQLVTHQKKMLDAAVEKVNEAIKNPAAPGLLGPGVARDGWLPPASLPVFGGRISFPAKADPWDFKER